MKTGSLVLAAAIASFVSVFVGAPARAYMVAGWDFSQYLAAGLLTIDGVNPATTLDANYSNLDPTFNAGAESAAFGTLYYDGQFGSSAIAVDGSGTEDVVPSQGSLTANLDEPVDRSADSPLNVDAVPFDSFAVLIAEGQQFANLLGMTAQIQGPVSLVFLADLSSVPETGSDWSVSFGGKTLSGTTPVEIEFSTNGSTYSSAGSVNLDTTDKRYSVNLSPTPSEQAFVRFHFDPAANELPIIDNVAINVPEPRAAAQLFAALVGLLVCARRRA